MSFTRGDDLWWFALVVAVSLTAIVLAYVDMTVSVVFWTLAMLILLVTRPL